jgi:hypothetical protein
MNVINQAGRFGNEIIPSHQSFYAKPMPKFPVIQIFFWVVH